MRGDPLDRPATAEVLETLAAAGALPLAALRRARYRAGWTPYNRTDG